MEISDAVHPGMESARRVRSGPFRHRVPVAAGPPGRAGGREDAFRLLRSVADGRGLPADHIRLGRFLALAGDADGAEHSLKQAARIDGGKTIEPQMALADFYHQIGDKQSELKRLRMAL